MIMPAAVGLSQCFERIVYQQQTATHLVSIMFDACGRPVLTVASEGGVHARPLSLAPPDLASAHALIREHTDHELDGDFSIRASTDNHQWIEVKHSNAQLHARINTDPVARMDVREDAVKHAHGLLAQLAIG